MTSKKKTNITQNKTKKDIFDRIRDMIRFIKKWWLLDNLHKAISLHSRFEPIERLSMGGKVLLSQNFFIVGIEEYPGLVYKSLHRFSWILRWRKKDNPEKLKKRIQEYNDIFRVCVEEGYIKMIEGEKDEQKIKMSDSATSKAYEISGWFGLLQGLLSKYLLAWTIIIIPLLLGIYGSPYLRKLIVSIYNLLKITFNKF